MAKVRIDGTEYSIPTLQDFTFDEAILVERLSGYSVAQIEQQETMPLGAVKAIIVVAIRRARPEVSEAEASKVVGRLPLLGIDEMFVTEEDEEAPAPDPTEQNEPSGSPAPSGEASSTAGEQSKGSLTPADSGDQASEPSASDLRTSAA